MYVLRTVRVKNLLRKENSPYFDYYNCALLTREETANIHDLVLRLHFTLHVHKFSKTLAKSTVDTYINFFLVLGEDGFPIELLRSSNQSL